MAGSGNIDRLNVLDSSGPWPSGRSFKNTIADEKTSGLFISSVDRRDADPSDVEDAAAYDHVAAVMRDNQILPVLKG